MKAFEQAKSVIQGLVDGSVEFSSILSCTLIDSLFKIPLEDTSLDAAKSSIVYGVTKGVSTPGRAVSQDLGNILMS